MTLPPDRLRWYGLQHLRVWSRVWGVVEWCGHRIEGTPVPTEDGRWRLILVEGEAT